MKIPEAIAQLIGKKRKQSPPSADADISGPFKLTDDGLLAFDANQSMLQFMFQPIDVKTKKVLAEYYVHQEHINMCGEACCVMLAKFAGEKAELPKKNPRGPFEGAEWDDLAQTYKSSFAKNLLKKNYVGASGNKWTIEQLKQQLLQVGPMMVSGEFVDLPLAGWMGHWVVIKGVQGDNVYLHDPWHGPNTKRSLKFMNEHMNFEDGCIVHKKFDNGYFKKKLDAALKKG